jgi:hypothetical protein
MRNTRMKNIATAANTATDMFCEPCSYTLETRISSSSSSSGSNGRGGDMMTTAVAATTKRHGTPGCHACVTATKLSSRGQSSVAEQIDWPVRRGLLRKNSEPWTEGRMTKSARRFAGDGQADIVPRADGRTDGRCEYLKSRVPSVASLTEGQTRTAESSRVVYKPHRGRAVPVDVGSSVRCASCHVALNTLNHCGGGERPVAIVRNDENTRRGRRRRSRGRMCVI